MFKFIFDLITEPLGLPIEWYYEWIILLVIGEMAYRVAYNRWVFCIKAVLYLENLQAHFFIG